MPPQHDLRLRRKQTEFLRVVSRLQRTLGAQVDASFSQAGFPEITTSRANVLMILIEARGPMTARSISRHMGLSEVTVGRFIKSLEANGWVERKTAPTDARARLVQPTPKAFAALPAFLAVSNAFLDRALGGVEGATLDTFLATLQSVQDNLESI
jgi:DNA-binding MarR family transcriptional regulator